MHGNSIKRIPSQMRRLYYWRKISRHFFQLLRRNGGVRGRRRCTRWATSTPMVIGYLMRRRRNAWTSVLRAMSAETMVSAAAMSVEETSAITDFDHLFISCGWVKMNARSSAEPIALPPPPIGVESPVATTHFPHNLISYFLEEKFLWYYLFK